MNEKIKLCVLKINPMLKLVGNTFDNMNILSMCYIKEEGISKMKNNFDTLGIKDVKFIREDSTRIKTNKKYNKILLDLPCTSSGTIRKNPDIKWKITQDTIREVKKIQYDILNNNSDDWSAYNVIF